MTNEEIMYEIRKLKRIMDKLLDARIGLPDDYEDVCDSLCEAYDFVENAITIYESKIK